MITGQTLRDLIAAEGVEILERGHSVSRGNFNIRCPFCGQADGGHHMGIRLDNGWWGCWRNAEHRGKSPVRLMCAVLNRPVWEVRRLLGIHGSPLLETFRGVRERLTRPSASQDVVVRAGTLQVPKSFRALWRRSEASARFVDYMEGRGFKGPVLSAVTEAYGLMYALTGPFADRIIMPYYYQDAVVTWTARTVHKDLSLRYRDLEQAASVIAKDAMLYNYDRASLGGRALVVLEGQFDVLKGDWAGDTLGVHCVGLGTNSITDEQTLLLCELSEAYERTYIALDTPTQFAKMDSYRLVSRLKGVVDVQAFDASSLGKDLGGASIRDAHELMRRIAA